MARIHEQDRGRIAVEHRARDVIERRSALALSVSKGACESVTRQIDQVLRRAGAATYPVDVREPRLAWRGARARDAGSNEGVNQTRFADIRTPRQRDFREPLSRKIARGGGTRDEFSGNLQWVIVSSAIASTGSAGSWAGTRPASDSASAIFRTSSIVWTM
jgi:hypothetical protein